MRSEAVRLTHLQLRDWRNMEALDVRPGEGVNLIRGENAQGKTNLLESIWILSGARSFRGAADAQLVRFGAARAVVEAAFFSEGRGQEMRAVFSPAREMTRNGVPCENGLPMVVFSPAHLSLVRDGPEQRRKFLDDAIGRIYPSYEQNLSYYRRALLQRNTLLRDAAMNASLLDLLDVWDENIARAGAQIVRLRRRYVERIREAAKEAYAGISSGRETLEVEYLSAASTPEEYREALRCARAEDLRLGHTTCGVHRDDLSLTINGLNARQYGSQGQQRSCVLALKLAECGILEECTGEGPIVLLDDVMSELDALRRDYLLHRIRGRQVFITCCEDILPAGEDVTQFVLYEGRFT